MHRVKAKGITENILFKKFRTQSRTCKEKSSRTTLRDDNWQLVEIYRDSPLYFFSLTPCESGGEEAILRPVMSRHNILYMPHTRNAQHTIKYVHYRGITIDLQDCLVKQASIFMPERREAKSKAKIWRMLREGRATKNIPSVLPLLNDPKGLYLLPTVPSLFF